MDEKRILLVDDEPLIQRSMQKTLQRAGYEVVTASDCASGLAAFQEAQQAGQPFDIAVLDLNMPGFDGQEASGAGLELLSLLVVLQPGVSVIILTAYDEVNKARQAISRGAVSFCVKGREQGLLEQIQSLP
jgi:DNA-binding NtrC family response regulator